MKRLGLVLALFAVALFATTAAAQEQTGSIVGKITADGGESLPGVAVEIKGPSGTLVSVTDAKGEYRFPRVTPGAYKLTARLQGFQTYENSRIPVTLGDRATVNVTLKISSVMETVVVTGERVQIAVGENATTTAIAAEQLALLPKNSRDFTSVVAQAPGASNEAFTGGIQIDGASGSENRFVIDGIDTTQPQDGLSGQGMVTDFIEEVQVKSAGYSAEFGGALGGVINAVTKSGTNEFHGTVGVSYVDSSLNGDPRPIYGQSYEGYYIQPNKDDQTRWEPGFSLGGPIVKDKLWFFAGYSPTLVDTTRTPLNTTSTFDQSQTFHYFSGNLKGNLGSKFVYKLSANISPSDQENSLPAQDGSTPSTADLTVDSKFPMSTYSFYADWVPSSNFYMTGRVGLYDQDTEVSGIDSLALFTFTSGVIPVPPTDPLYRPTGYNSTPTFTSTDQDNWKRTAAGLDFNLFATALGTHALKAGVAYELIENVVDTGQNGNQYRIRWNTAYLGQRGSAGSVEVRRFRTDGQAESTNYGLYIQDTWTIHPNLTLNLGVRAEQERVPNYGYNVDPTLPEYAIEFDFQDKLAPRLGFAWDVTGKQKIKLYGSYGEYFDITKLEMPRGSYGADKWVSHVYALNTTNWPSIAVGCSIVDNTMGQDPCPHLGPQVVRDFRRPSDPTDGIDPDLKPMQNREFQLGVDWQVTKNSVVSARYVNKSLVNTIEDIGYLVTYPDGTTGEEYITGNPGKGVVAGDPDGSGPIPAQAEAIRDYEAIELTYARRFADSFSLRASYVYSKLSGNYSGLASTDEFGRTDPNVARYFDGLAYGFDSNGSLVDGVLNTDRPHSFEMQGLYQAPWGTSFGLNFLWQSGAPRTTLATYAQVEFYPNGRNDIGRYSSWNQTDLMISHPFRIGDSMSLEVYLNVLNLFDQDAVFRTGTYQFFEDLCDVDHDCDYSNEYYFNNIVPYDYTTFMTQNGATPNPQYGKPIAWQNPRNVRLGLKFIF